MNYNFDIKSNNISRLIYKDLYKISFQGSNKYMFKSWIITFYIFEITIIINLI
jgi:hypothetical protein